MLYEVITFAAASGRRLIPARAAEMLGCGAFMPQTVAATERFSKSPNVDRLIDQAAIAGGFTAVVANTAANAGERIVHLDDPQGILPTP